MSGISNNSKNPVPIRHRIVPQLRQQYCPKSPISLQPLKKSLNKPLISIKPTHESSAVPDTSSVPDTPVAPVAPVAPPVASASDNGPTGETVAPARAGPTVWPEASGPQLVIVTKKAQLSSVPWEVPVVLPRKPWIVASFDIGIKTLSYCIMSRDRTLTCGNNYQIYDWDIIDLMPSDTKNLVCEFPLGSGKRKGQPCGKMASYSHKGPNDTLKGVCGTHSGKIPGANIIRERRVNNMSNVELNIEVIKALDQRHIFLEVDEVLLEHQPSKNPRMKNLSYMLHSYFVLRGLVDAQKGEKQGRIQNVRFISPKNKLNVYDGPPVAQKYKRPYDENKYRSKVYTEYLVRGDPEKLAYFKGSHKKRDDLGDAFLQGAWYLKKQRK